MRIATRYTIIAAISILTILILVLSGLWIGTNYGLGPWFFLASIFGAITVGSIIITYAEKKFIKDLKKVVLCKVNEVVGESNAEIIHYNIQSNNGIFKVQINDQLYTVNTIDNEVDYVLHGTTFIYQKT